MISFIVLFLIGSSILIYTQLNTQNQHLKEIKALEKKEDITKNIDDAFTQAFLDFRGYFAYSNMDLKNNALDQKPAIEYLLRRHKTYISTEDDSRFFNEMNRFLNYYFIDQLPKALNNFENNRKELVSEQANSNVTGEIKKFQQTVDDYRRSLREEINNRYDLLNHLQQMTQWAMFIFVLVMLIILLILTRLSLNRIGRPIRELAASAEKIIQGKETSLPKVKDSQKDEIAVLTRSFTKMVQSIKENEQHFIDTNDELLHQQEELQAQQLELEKLVGQMEERENRLSNQNELINSLSNSLNKNEILTSIVKGFSSIINADRGMIVLLDKEFSHATWGISESGAQQFIQYIFNGLNERILVDKKPLVTMRSLTEGEKGYHTEGQSCYDLFLPVLNSSYDVEAIMVYTRFGYGFNEQEIEEFSSLSKQISLSLDKISIFEASEVDRRMNQDILNTIQEGIQLINTEGDTLHLNEKFYELFDNRELQKFVHTPYTTWLKAFTDKMEEPKTFETFITDLIDSENTVIEKIQYIIQHPVYRVIQVYAEPLYRNNVKVGWVIVHRDRTKESEADQMKNELVSTVSHELRTPLASVLGFTELLITKELKEERQKKYLSTIYGEAKRLTNLINDFLDVQRMESGKQVYEMKYDSITPVIRDVIEREQVQTTAHTIQFARKVEQDTVLADKDKLGQVFQNLLHNAVKYSPDGGNINVVLDSDQKNFLVSITDEGLGIPAEAIPNLFAKFYRVDNTDRRKIGGTGLGLSIAKEIMKAHGGDITIHSQQGIGSTFTVFLPKVADYIQEDGSFDEACEGKGGNVLIVEDDQNLAALLTSELNDSGFKITTYDDGHKALEAIKRELPDAIVLDIMLEHSDIDGWNILEELKTNNELKHIPIFVSSALDEKEKGLGLGAKGYLVKPYSPSQLSKLILQTLWSINRKQ